MCIRDSIRPGSRVLDVGSGYSIFFLVGTDWDFDIHCCDLDSAAMEKMRSLVPGWDWVVADALSLPWADDHFDVVYAGEIIEHLPGPEEALAAVSYTHLRAHETRHDLVCRLL